MKSKLEYGTINYTAIADIIQCPVCEESMRVINHSLVCANNHTIDINKKGIASFSRTKNDDTYTKDLFSARKRVLECGLYDEVFKAIIALIEPLDIKVVLDAGTGEGSYLKSIKEALPSLLTIGIDLARDGLNIASSHVDSAWILGDLAALPFKDHSIDLVLNILSPANYEEFKRVLSAKGYLLKVIVNPGYLKEIREALGLEIHENKDVLLALKGQMDVICTQDICYRCEVDEALSTDLLKMTPLAKNQKGNINFYQISIDLKLVLCKVKHSKS